MKDKRIEKTLDNLTKTLGFKNTRSESLKKKICVMCSNPNLNFKDKLSKKEYTISGLCQTCQDDYFN